MYLIDSFFFQVVLPHSLFLPLFLVGGIFILNRTPSPSLSLLCLSLSHILLPSPFSPLSLSSSKPNIAPFIFALLLCFVFCSLWGQRISNLCIFSICHSAGEWQRNGKEEGKKSTTEEKRWMGSFDFRVLVNFPQLSFAQKRRTNCYR